MYYVQGLDVNYRQYGLDEKANKVITTLSKLSAIWGLVNKAQVDVVLCKETESPGL